MYCVYALIDVRTGLPFYVGKGLKENNRYEDHFKESVEKNTNKHKVHKIQYLFSHGYEIPVAILANDIEIEDDAYDVESGFIRFYGRENIDPNGILTNICIDNRPPSWKGKKQDPAHIANRVKSYMETCKAVGRKPHTEEAKRAIARPGESNPFYGKHHTEETKQAHSARMKGNKNNSKEYVFTSPDGTDYIVEGSFYKFCNDNNLTTSTMEKALQSGKMPSSGKCKGWSIKRKEQ
ncbi:MAG TPA: NUMOD3 domain-containing DNA-binding protein [Methanosarcina sp.]|nr:NUMOD3 domain-containing DNA-binding protein [Methanosarcina sp.]